METSITLFDLNKDQLSEAINSVKAKLKELGLDKLDFTLYKQLVIKEQTKKKGGFVFEGLVTPNLKEQVEQLESELKKILGSYGEQSCDVDVFHVEIGPGEGEKFPTLNDLNVVPSKESGKSFACAEGEVVLIDFWSTGCGPCQGPMQHNQEMLEKNEDKWRGKARIVAVGLDWIESLIKRVEERKWEKIEHYQSPGGFSAPVASQLGIQRIPCAFLVDKKGMIRYRGHPSFVNLEDKINELIAEGDDKPTTAIANDTKVEGGSSMVCTSEGCSIVHAQKPTVVNMETEVELIKKFQESHEAYKHLIEKLGLTVGLVGNREFKANGEETFDGRVVIGGPITPKDKEAVLEYYKNVIQPLPKEFRVDNRLRLYDLPEVTHGTSCATCKKALGKGTSHYVCTACQAEGKEECAFCVECADKELTQEVESGKDLFHQHGLLFIYEDTEDALKTIKRVMNKAHVVSEDESEFAELKAEKVCGSVYCGSCGKAPPVYRWACANCPDFDFCTECFKASRDANHEKHNEVTEKTASKGHDKSHVFYRSHYLMYLDRGEAKKFEFPSNA